MVTFMFSRKNKGRIEPAFILFRNLIKDHISNMLKDLCQFIDHEKTNHIPNDQKDHKGTKGQARSNSCNEHRHSNTDD